MSGQRLRLTTSRPAGYRRGGQVIGGAAAPAFIGPGDVTPEQLLAILRDPNIAVAIEIEEDVFRALTAEERADIEEQAEGALFDANGSNDPAPGGEPNTAEPQGGEVAASAEASQESGAVAAPTGSAASAGGVATDGLLPGGGELSANRTEPTAPELAPAPEPAAEPKPASKGRGRAKGSPA